MPIRKTFHSISQETIYSLLSSHKSSLWIGSLSFEKRCLASLHSLSNHSIRPTRGIVINYSTQVHPSGEDIAYREKNWNEIVTLEGPKWVEKDMLTNIEPYSFQQFQEVVGKYIDLFSPDITIFDITCMTKIHSLALAAMVAQFSKSFKWIVTYSIPENYVNIGNSTRSPGWRDVIVAPLAETAVLFYEEHSRGIVIPGHEADRLIVGLSELDPSGGLILMASTPKRPDLLRLSHRINRKPISRLLRMHAKDWNELTLGINDLKEMGNYIDNEIDLAKEHGSPIILFPYGPKPLIFFTAIQLCYHYPQASWFVYPIPTGYDVNYTEGVENTYWFFPHY